MTVAANNWCSTCQEGCHGHPTICDVCGTTLGAPPARPATSTEARVRAVPEFMTENIREASRAYFNGMMTGLGGHVPGLDAATREAMMGEEWQAAPAEALDPQAHSHGRPTSKKALADIPRIVLESKSSIFQHASIDIMGEDGIFSSHLQAVPGELGPGTACSLENVTLIVASPRTGKGGLSEETKLKISTVANAVVYMERGDGVTFVQKAILAQQCGASAVVIGNNMSAPWPYVMKDSKGEAETSGLTIPVVMVKQSDGQKIVEASQKQKLRSHLRIRTMAKECVVCRDSFEVSQKVLQLPACGHVFHEQCALVWLTKQNTCPYCRRELQTDDQDYEDERRRTQRTHAGSTSTNTGSNYETFYG
jgi:hypothetical protein